MGEVLKSNASGSLDNIVQNEDVKFTINTMQRTAYVARMAVKKHSYADIIDYDIDNLYPNKVKSIAERSGSVKTAINTLSAFITGEGFENGNDEIINEEKQTLWDLLRHVCSEKSMFSGFGLHFNYNVFGEIFEINEISFETLRWGKDMNKIVFNPDWSKRNSKAKDVEYNLYNPENALKEIEEAGGIENYTGQVLYWQPRIKDIYPLCRFDSVIDDAQFEAESKIYKLSNIQNDYSIGGIFKYPASIESRQELIDMRKSLAKGKGSANAGKIQPVPVPPGSEALSSRLFEPISRNNIDGLFKMQNEEARFNIYAAFQQAPILNGVSSDGMFNQDQFVDAFNYYNTFTETDRKEVEKIFTKIIEASVWANLGELKIIPKNYLIKEEKNNDNGGDITDNN